MIDFMIEEYKGYIISVESFGDSITPMYRYKLYRPKKHWWSFKTLLWEEYIHRKYIDGKLSGMYDYVISKYEEDLERWN